jgi:hypothetical protein
MKFGLRKICNYPRLAEQVPDWFLWGQVRIVRKEGQGGFETSENPPKSPFAKRGFSDQEKSRRGEKPIRMGALNSEIEGGNGR